MDQRMTLEYLDGQLFNLAQLALTLRTSCRKALGKGTAFDVVGDHGTSAVDLMAAGVRKRDENASGSHAERQRDAALALVRFRFGDSAATEAELRWATKNAGEFVAMLDAALGPDILNRIATVMERTVAAIEKIAPAKPTGDRH